MESISGIITRINYYNPENGYTVVILELDYKDKTIAMKKSKIVGNTIALVGYFDREPHEMEEYTFDGDFVKDRNYGLQFKFNRFERKAIKTEQGIISYLSSDMFPGIGPKIAKTIVEKLGLNCLTLIKENENVLNKVNLTDKQKTVIKTGIISDQINQETVVFFLDNGISMDMAHKIISIFGDMAKEMVLENPYILMEKIERFGFKKNDAFALKIGIKENSIVRLKALITYVLQESLYSVGNSYIAKIDLYDYTIKYLGQDIDVDVYDKVLEILSSNKKIYIDINKNIFDYKMYIQELELAVELSKILKGKRDLHQKMIKYDESDIYKNYYKIKNHSHLEFSKEQENAILSAFTEPIIIITGGPGTGKTTIVKAIIEMYLKLNKDNTTVADYIALLAPTGKAAKRLKESTQLPSMTIHKYLGYMGGNSFTYSKYNKTAAKLIIVDEASMMDLPLASRLITSMQDDARIIIVGDVDQLPSVGPGQVLKDLIDSREIKTIRLTKIHRQAENSSIIKLAHNINEGILPENILDKLNDRVFIATDNSHLSSILVDATSRYISRGYDIKKDLQILIPMYKGDCGINEINSKIQDLVNPLKDENEQIKHYGQVFRENDKVIQLVNRAEKGIMNGDVGYIHSFIYKDLKIIGLRIAFDQNIIEYSIEELEDLSLAYAISVHKAQGGEFDIVIMPISSKHFVMLKRKLIYTAITRAKKILILIGDVQIMQQGIRKIENNRKTILKNKLIEYINSDFDEMNKNQSIKRIIEEDEDELGSIFSELKESDFDNFNS
ncbi:MAG: ATP-dependent RecD-like DNA helicase [Bacilli bacterium]|nr:ATP-dependent RecD-like DNA helicase [Staphylococcus sp.]